MTDALLRTSVVVMALVGVAQAQTPAAPALKLVSFSYETLVQPYRLTSGDAITFPDDIIAAVQGSGYQFREKVVFDSVTNLLEVEWTLVPGAIMFPTPPNLLETVLVAHYTVAVTKADATGSQFALAGKIIAERIGSSPFLKTATSESPTFDLPIMRDYLMTLTGVFTPQTTDVTGLTTAMFSKLVETVAGLGTIIGDSGQGTIKVNSPAGTAQLPQAIASPKGLQTTRAQFTLDGSKSSDPNGGALTYKWVYIKTGGLIATISGDTSAMPVVTIQGGSFAYGTYMFQLTVTNPAGLTASDTVSVEYVSPD